MGRFGLGEVNVNGLLFADADASITLSLAVHSFRTKRDKTRPKTKTTMLPAIYCR